MLPSLLLLAASTSAVYFAGSEADEVPSTGSVVDEVPTAGSVVDEVPSTSSEAAALALLITSSICITSAINILSLSEASAI